MTNTPQVAVERLIERIKESVGQLRRMAAMSNFGGQGTSVRVKDPAYLIEILGKSHAALASLSAEKAALEKENERLSKAVGPHAKDFMQGLVDECSAEIVARRAAEFQLAEARVALERRDRMAANSTRFWVRAAKAALAGKPQELRNRIDMAEAPPVEVVLSAALALPAEQGEE